MADGELGTVIRHIRKLVAFQGSQEMTDRQLLFEFMASGDGMAFAALVRRHGPLVFAVCRRVLFHQQDAEDAFQATFLVLAQKAASIRKAEALASWLHGVAYRIAVKAKRAAARRRAHEREVKAVPTTPSNFFPDRTWPEVQVVLDEEIQRLPEKYRAIFLLCCLEGKHRTEVAKEFGLKEATVRSRLSQARKQLQHRLSRRGITLSALLGAAAITGGATRAAVPAALAAVTVRSVLIVASKAPAAGLVSPEVAALVKGATKAMFLTKLKTVTGLLLAAGFVAAGAGVLAQRESATQPAAQSRTESASPKEEKGGSPKLVAEKQVRTDQYGDALPPGAVARLGSIRFYHGSSKGCINRVILSPDGQRVISETLPPVDIRLWDANTGKDLPLREELKSASFFPAGGKLVAVTSQGGRTVLWDVIANQEIARLQTDLPSRAGIVGLSTDGKTLAWKSSQVVNGEFRSALHFASVPTGKVLSIELKKDLPVTTFMFSADNKTLAIHYGDNSIDVWNVPNHLVMFSLPTVKTRFQGQSALSADGKTLAISRHDDNQITLWDISKKKELPPLSVQPGRCLGGLAFSPDGKYLAAGYEMQVGLWDLTKRQEIRRLPGQESGISCLVFTADGKQLFGADGNGVSIWDLAAGKLCHDFGHTYTVDGVAFAPDGKTVATGAAYSDPVVRVWNARTGRCKGQWRGHTSGLEAIAYSPDGKLVASGSQDQSVRLWDAESGKEVRRLEAHDGMIYAMAFAPDGKTIASGGLRKAVHLWDVATGHEVRSFNNPGSFILRLTFSPNGKILATRGMDERFVRLWNVATGIELRRLDAPGAGCPSLSFSPDGKVLAANGDDATIRLWEVATGRELRTIGEPLKPGQANRCLSVAYSPDGRLVAAGYDDSTVRLWELASGRERSRFGGHRGCPLMLAFSDDGTLLASGSADRTVLIWDVRGESAGFRATHNQTDTKEFKTLWEKLQGTDAAEAYRAMQALRGAGKDGVLFLKQHLQSGPAPDRERLQQLIADLDSNHFAVRANAARELEKFGELAEPGLRMALAGKPSAEVRRQVERLLEHLAVPTSQQLQTLRAVEVLEQIGTLEAKKVLADLARGAPEARLPHEAKASLERLGKRPAVTP